MKLSKMALVAAIACGIHAGSAFGQQAGNGIQQVACADCDCGQPVCGCEDPAAEGCCDTASCDSGCGSACDSGCGLGSALDGLGCCDLGDPWTLFDEHCGWSAGGWTQVGYHSANLRNFNNRDGEVQLQQAWLYAQKAIDTSDGFDIGGRLDYVYGTDAQDTQVFGTNRGWDSGWDNGAVGNGYGNALPQAYFEAGYGDLSVKVGHFFTIIGWEVVQATGNFFYSHAYTMYNSEPFTHTGTLATYNLSDTTTIWGGHVFGWDGGFDDNGDAFLGGISQQVTDEVKVIYAAIGGRFSEPGRFGGTAGNAERGYMHSFIFDVAVTDNLQYIWQNDILDSELGTGGTGRNTFDINQYLIYTLNDCWSVGGRFEWYNVDQTSELFGGNAAVPGNVDIYALTAGLNYKPHANVVVRPEVRYDWVADDPALAALAGVSLLENNERDQFTFGMDTIFTF